MFNLFDPETFVSASADWNIKVWNTKNKKALLCFEMGQALVDVVWSSFSSSVFIALSLDKFYLFDLGQNRYQAVYEHKSSKNRFITLAFNVIQPILLVGDYQGGVTSYKISNKIAPTNKLKTNDYIQK